MTALTTNELKLTFDYVKEYRSLNDYADQNFKSPLLKGHGHMDLLALTRGVNLKYCMLCSLRCNLNKCPCRAQLQ